MDENKVEIVLDIIQLKISKLLNNQKDLANTKFELLDLMHKREKVYELDEETINKIYNDYALISKENKNGIK